MLDIFCSTKCYIKKFHKEGGAPRSTFYKIFRRKEDSFWFVLNAKSNVFKYV